ncbi:plantaricin C family lantibiotic [Paenibacillus sp. 1-18]|uniref:plantaricin C family lantibiotic n=1 Tax=Paenibacillus sp. 1-18 TaxID=1333846 RepID=UPI00047066D4|nr:plantaricin C family lantibiotic [Paenibacillus sp. 1-18]
MKNELRNPISRGEFMHPAGNVMEELGEAELQNFAAGGGIPWTSGGAICTLTHECAGTHWYSCC